jgi:hypothetical protein
LPILEKTHRNQKPLANNQNDSMLLFPRRGSQRTSCDKTAIPDKFPFELQEPSNVDATHEKASTTTLLLVHFLLYQPSQEDEDEEENSVSS